MAGEWIRRRLSISLRGLILLVLGLGCLLGWTVRRSRLQSEAVAAIKRAGGYVEYASRPEGKPDAPPLWRRWLIDHLGIDYLDRVVWVRGAGAGFDDTTMIHVSRLEYLEHLGLSLSPNVTDAGLLHLAGLSRLRHLDLDLDGVRGPGLAALGGMSELETLRVGRMKIADADFAHLANLKKLKVLEASNNERLTDAGLAHLAALTELRDLNLAWTRVTGRGLVHLRGLRKLERLNLAQTQVETLEPIRGLPELIYLHLIGCPIGEGIAPAASFNKLTYLVLSNTQVDDAGLKALSGLSNLKELLLNETKVTDAGLVHLERSRFSDRSPRELRDAPRYEGRIVITHTSGELDLMGTGVTRAGVDAFRASHPDCLVKTSIPADR
jgi:hypothetical protein